MLSVWERTPRGSEGHNTATGGSEIEALEDIVTLGDAKEYMDRTYGSENYIVVDDQPHWWRIDLYDAHTHRPYPIYGLFH